MVKTFQVLFDVFLFLFLFPGSVPAVDLTVTVDCGVGSSLVLTNQGGASDFTHGTVDGLLIKLSPFGSLVIPCAGSFDVIDPQDGFFNFHLVQASSFGIAYQLLLGLAGILSASFFVYVILRGVR